MTYLITGVAGFVGTNLVRNLLEEGQEVIGIDSLDRRGSEANLNNLQKDYPNFDFRKRDIKDIPELILRENPDLVYHFAAQVAVTSSLESPRRDFSINATGTMEVALAANSVDAPVIYTSTNKVFGDNVNSVELTELQTRYDFLGELKGVGISDSFPIDSPNHTPYGLSKLVGDLYVREFGGVSNRCSCMYGHHQNGIVDQGWLSHIAKLAIQGKPVTIYGDGKQVRDVLHAKDVVNLLRLQADKLLSDPSDIQGQAFAIGGGYQNTISLLELCDRWKIPEERVKFSDWRPADQKVFYCNLSKAKIILDWQPEVGLDDGLEDLYQWTKNQLSH
ncbi:MAG: GDP-mannose 4,6-dehydratase [Nanoarchaeota archaeon]|nr:GDP-mannose 4,6-dehydratase [Nanoarchaeota archaeon]